MQYDFDTPVERRRTGSLKWDVGESELPMWVADMDFKTAPEIVDALRRRTEIGAYGYSIVPNEWYEAIGDWWEKRHHFRLEKDWLLFSTGVVPTLSSAVRKLTTPAEHVVVQTPVYNIFYNCIQNNGRTVLENPLKYENGRYEMDFSDLEEKLKDPQTTLMILCNPQNPAGKIWERDTLARVGELCAKYHVTVIADEIHCDLTAPGKEYVPFASVSELCRDNSVTCIAPTKTFNLAGLQTSAISVPNPNLCHKVKRGINTDEVAEPNFFAVTAAVAAFREGAPWLDALRGYLQKNREIVADFIGRELPEIQLVQSDATYLLWLDCGAITKDSEELAGFIRQKTGLYLSDGAQYGGNGAQFLRLNIACPAIVLKEGLARLKQGVVQYQM